MRFLLLSSSLAALTSSVLADVHFTSPAAGASIPAGAITVTWKDSGKSPSLSQLAAYQLFLMVGGNREDDAVQLTSLGSSNFADGNEITGTIDPAIAESLNNGFYLKMISTASEGGTVINYSDRFTLTGMTGKLDDATTSAVEALGGTTAGPETEDNVAARQAGAAAAAAAQPAAAQPAAGAAGAAPAAVAPAAAAPPAAAAEPAQYSVPYGEQSGLTKYAPMQGVPPTKISNKKFSPVYPTSAWTVAKTWLPQPTIVTTLTETQTFSVKSRANTASPQSHPQGGDMAKYLARWKD